MPSPGPSVGHFGPSSVAVRSLALGGADAYANGVRLWFWVALGLGLLAVMAGTNPSFGTTAIGTQITQSGGVAAPRPSRPIAKCSEVEVMRGESVRIVLRGYERNLNPLEYRILSGPRYGRLSRVEQPSNSQGPAYVTYTHGDDPDSKTDTFAFEAIATTGRRGSGDITIRILQ